jgi:hypothetical protein
MRGSGIEFGHRFVQPLVNLVGRISFFSGGLRFNLFSVGDQNKTLSRPDET